MSTETLEQKVERIDKAYFPGSHVALLVWLFVIYAWSCIYSDRPLRHACEARHAVWSNTAIFWGQCFAASALIPRDSLKPSPR